MTDYQKAFAALKVKAETDAALRTELLANPRSVFSRETGIAADELEQMLGDAELKEVTGGGYSWFEGNWIKCSNCDVWTFADLMGIHRLFAHGTL